ncbi:peptidylprolyl isomerase [Devosia sp.]|uniref:peptidylprolyl isomerase n=1 Tax=Devosia sp. TaxID=1871048 RepID=UPI002736C966|nr:peptidylprolyl isomerase [Devosia sp.]MDP2781841.1 SurA N-terminal domain-containing protein [Devosia sp.]
MLDSLRGFAKSWAGKILGAFLLVGLAGFGINNVITDLGTNTVARVGDAEIDSRTFLRAYERQLNQVAQQLGSVPTAEQAMSLGIPSMVLQNLAQDAALDQLADDFGVGASEAKLSELLRADPSFQGTLGAFDPQAFTQVLRQNGLTEAQYFEDQSNVARREQVVLSLFADTGMPQTASSLINRYVADQRTVDFFVLGDTNVDTPAVPTEDELAAYLSEHQGEFRTVESRTVQMLRLSPADLAATKTIGDDAIAAEYERTKAGLTKAERRTIQQVVLNDAQVAAFEAGLAAGTPFETLVSDNALTATDLGSLAEADISDANLATAAFGLADGEFAIIDGVTGKRAVHVSAIEAGGVPSLAEAREQIAQNLARSQARDEVADVQDQVEELRAAFRPLSEIAARFGLDIYEADVTASGAELNVLPELDPADASRISQAIFKAEKGQLTAAIPLAGSGNLYFDLIAIEPARDQTLDEVREDVLAALTAERTNAALLAASADAVAKLDAGTPIADVAASYNVFPQLSTPFSRFGAADGSIDGVVAGAAFAGGSDHHGSALNESGEYVVFQVVDVIAGEGPLDPAAQANLENEARVGLYGEFVTAIRDDAGLRVNQQALQQTLAINTGL